MDRVKTIFLDIDGTLLHHTGRLSDQLNDDIKPIDGTIEKLLEWDKKGYNIILTTGRRKSMRNETERQLEKLKIFYDELIMGIGGGERIIINDKKLHDHNNTCRSINIERNSGIKNIIL